MHRRVRSWRVALVAIALVTGACSDADDEVSDATRQAAAPATSVTTSTPPTDAGLDDADRSPGRAVILDYSPTVSDIGALLYLLTHPDVDLIAITLPAAGEAGCDLGLEVTRGVLALLEQQHVPVACDPDRPEHAGEWPAEFLEDNDSLAAGLPAVTRPQAEPLPAPELIAEVVAASEAPVTLVAVAPLTNIARALERHPETIDGLDEIVIMGGAVDVPGNVAGSAAEWNIWIDVPAAAQVLESGAPLTLVPLDATNDLPVPPFWQRDLALAEQSAAIEYLASLVANSPAVTSGFFYLWDELAAAVAAGDDPVMLAAMELTIMQEAGPEYGRTAPSSGGADVSVAVAVTDPAHFYERYLTTLAGAPVDRSTSVVGTDLPPTSVTPRSAPAEVLAFWLDRAMGGRVADAAAVVAPGAVWVGLGASPDTFASGSAPYGAYDVEFACTQSGSTASCTIEWSDVWIEAIPELERGSLQVEAEVIDGQITAFEGFAFGTEIAAAFVGHISWLESEDPDAVEAACAPDPGVEDCSELLVSTVEAWIAGR